MSILSGRLFPVNAGCGHKTWKKRTIEAFGTRCKMEIPIGREGAAYCHDCLEKMTIRCAWCGKPIFIGDPVTLYSPSQKDFQVPEYAVRYSENPLRLVGCLRWECADSGMDRCGFWLPPGIVQRVISPLEQVMMTGTTAIVQDLGDIREAVETSKKLSEKRRDVPSDFG